MPDSNRRRRPELNRMQRQELLEDRRLKGRLLTMNILTIAFYMATVVYLVIILAGIMKQPEHSAGEPMWWALAVAIFEQDREAGTR